MEALRRLQYPSSILNKRLDGKHTKPNADDISKLICEND